jgi:hypothetical protein
VPRLTTKIGLVCAAAWAVSGCSGASPLLEKETYTNMFSNSSRMFDVSDLMRSDRHNEDASLGPSGPVAPEDLVTADGRCAVPTAQTAEAQSRSTTPPADRPVGSLAGDLAGTPMAAAPPAASQVSAPPPDRLQPDGLSGGSFMPRVMGGVALGMTECQVVRRTGAPSNVAITAGSVDGKGERKVVLTYDGGSRPGVYRFASGRLQVIEGLPVQTQTAKPKSRRKESTTGSARRSAGHVYVQ